MTSLRYLIILMALVAYLGTTDGKKKVLILTVQMGGHVSEFGTIANELISKGYEVHAILDENIPTPPQLDLQGLQILRYRSPDKDKVDAKAFDVAMSIQAFSSRDEWILTEKTRPRLTYDCELLLNDKFLYEKLVAEKYSAALVDGMVYCYHLIPYRLGIPMITVSAYQWPLMIRLSPLIAHASCVHPPKNIFERLFETYNAITIDATPSREIDETPFLDYLPGRHLTSLREIAEETKLWLMALGNFVDCPNPTPPNVIFTGGMNTKPAKALPTDLMKFMDSAKDGVIIVSFGSMLSNQPKHFLQKLLTAFDKIKQKVVWRVAQAAVQDLRVPEKIKLLKWLPQNDLLGHPNTKLFITHCGNNGQWEGFYHGIPMLGIPLFGDQFRNAERLMRLGVGNFLDLWTFTPAELAGMINELVYNASYKENARRLSEQFHSLPQHPSKTAGYWVDHVITYGADHLTSFTFQMPLYQYYMVDIVVVLLLVALLALVLLKCAVKFILRKLWKTERKTKTA